MKITKISAYLLVFLTVFVIQTSVNAEETITTYSGITMTEEQHDNLKELGFSELAIDQMEKKVFEENKDLQVDSQSEVTKYYEIKETPTSDQNSSLSKTSEETESYISTELSEEEYFKKVKESTDEPQVQSLSTTDQSSTSYRRLTTSIQKIGTETRFYEKFIWDKIPKTRSYDMLSVSLDSTFTPKSGTQYAQQLWTTTHRTYGGIYGDSANYSSSSSKWKKSGAGYGVKMNLKNDTTTMKVYELEGYMYYKIARSSSVVPNYINAYGSYAHAKTSVSSSYSFGLSFGGPAISWSGVSSSSFDTITTHAQKAY